MLYQRPSFTVPASNNTSQKQWDLAFLSEEEFAAKYPAENKEKIDE